MPAQGLMPAGARGRGTRRKTARDRTFVALAPPETKAMDARTAVTHQDSTGCPAAVWRRRCALDDAYPGGHRFGQASAAALSQDPKVGPLLAAATRLPQLVTSRARVTTWPDRQADAQYRSEQITALSAAEERVRSRPAAPPLRVFPQRFPDTAHVRERQPTSGRSS